MSSSQLEQAETADAVQSPKCNSFEPVSAPILRCETPIFRRFRLSWESTDGFVFLLSFFAMTVSIRSMLAAAACAAALAASTPALADLVDPDAPAVLLNNAQVPAVVDKLIGRADYQKALNLIAEGLKANPHSAQLRFQRCVVYERMGDRQKAKDGFERMIRTYPEIPEPYNNLAGIYSREGNLTRAEELLVKALALRPNFALAHMNLGNLYLAKAKNAYNSAIKTGGNKEKLNANIRAIDKLLAD